MHVISKCCRGIHKQGGGFIWVYDKDVDKVKERTLDAHPNSKKIGQYDLDGNLIKVWNSATDAYKALGVNQGSLSDCCHGRRKKAKGFVWKFV